MRPVRALTRDEVDAPGGPLVAPGAEEEDQEGDTPDVIWPNEELPPPTLDNIKEAQAQDRR